MCEDFLCLNRLICATSLVLLIDFSFFNVLDLNKLIKYSIDANMTRSQARPRQSLAGVVSSRANPPPLGGPQPHHQSFLSKLLWKEVSVAVTGHLEVVLLHLQSRLFDLSDTNTRKSTSFQHQMQKVFCH